MRGIVVAEHQGTVGGLAMVDVREALDASLGVDEFPKMKLTLVGEEDGPPHVTGRGATFVERDVVRLHDRRRPLAL